MRIKVSKQRGKDQWWVEAFETDGAPIFHAIKSVYKNPLNGVYYFDHKAFNTLDQAIVVAKSSVKDLVNGESF